MIKKSMSAEELKLFRLRLGFRSQRALAEAMSVPKKTIENWEQGRRPIPMWVEKFLKCLEEQE